MWNKKLLSITTVISGLIFFTLGLLEKNIGIISGLFLISSFFAWVAILYEERKKLLLLSLLTISITNLFWISIQFLKKNDINDLNYISVIFLLLLLCIWIEIFFLTKIGVYIKNIFKKYIVGIFMIPISVFIVHFTSIIILLIAIALISMIFNYKMNDITSLYLVITIGFIWNVYAFSFINKLIHSKIKHDYLRNTMNKIYNRKMIRVYIYTSYLLSLIFTNIYEWNKLIEVDYKNAIMGSFVTFLAVERITVCFNKE